MSNWSRCKRRIRHHRVLHKSKNIGIQNFPFWEQPIGAVVLEQRGESLVQPNVGPPFNRYTVAKPLMSPFVGDHSGHSQFAFVCVGLLVVQQVGFAEIEKWKEFFFNN